MAKATSPLFAVEASGQLGKAVVYDRRGYVRAYAKPSNPQTDAQANVRTPFRAVAAVIRVIGKNATEDIRAQASPAYRWNAYIVKHTLGPNMHEWNLSTVSFNALGADGQNAWDTAAQNAGITPTHVEYDEYPPDKLAGRALWAVANALWKRGIGPAEPTADNANTWVSYLTR